MQALFYVACNDLSSYVDIAGVYLEDVHNLPQIDIFLVHRL